jgi:hypothetical protein
MGSGCDCVSVGLDVAVAWALADGRTLPRPGRRHSEWTHFADAIFLLGRTMTNNGNVKRAERPLKSMDTAAAVVLAYEVLQRANVTQRHRPTLKLNPSGSPPSLEVLVYALAYQAGHRAEFAL